MACAKRICLFGTGKNQTKKYIPAKHGCFGKFKENSNRKWFTFLGVCANNMKHTKYNLLKVMKIKPANATQICLI